MLGFVKTDEVDPFERMKLTPSDLGSKKVQKRAFCRSDFGSRF
jgi:hypothetical protein